MMERVKQFINPEAAKRHTLAKACMMTFEQTEPGRIVYEWLKEEYWNVLTYNPNHDIMHQIEGRRQLLFALMELIEEGKKGEKKAVEVVA